MDYVVTVECEGQRFKYWVEAPTPKDAEARGYRLHCASENFNNGKRNAVADCVEVK